MSLVLADRVRETSATKGTGTFTLDGAVAGFQAFSVIGNNSTTFYAIQGTTQWEVGLGTYYANTLARDTLISSSTGSFIDFATGSKDVFITLPAENTITSIASSNASVTVTQTGSAINLAVPAASALWG
jgi:hypothetical protein